MPLTQGTVLITAVTENSLDLRAALDLGIANGRLIRPTGVRSAAATIVVRANPAARTRLTGPLPVRQSLGISFLRHLVPSSRGSE
jgi:hypothetical protein